MALSPSFDTLGPLVRAPADLRIAWAALSGCNEPGRHPRKTAAPGRALIATAEQLGAVEPQAAAAVQRVAERLDLPIAAGEVPRFSRWSKPRATVIGFEALEAHRAAGLYPGQAAMLGDEIREAHLVAESISQAQVIRARQELATLAHELRAKLGPGDILLTPALPSLPPPRAYPSSAVAGQLTRFVAPVNAAGLAAAVVPEGSWGVQMIAADVPTLLAAADRL
jgi:Asp-tRNA(Asn)/Glu-tRNA(Gln) amidotransferase A subunit family amidase